MSAWLSLSTHQINVKNSKGGCSAPPLYKKERLKTQKERRLGLPESQCSTGTIHLPFSLFYCRTHCWGFIVNLLCSSKKVEPGQLPIRKSHLGPQKVDPIKTEPCRENRKVHLMSYRLPAETVFFTCFTQTCKNHIEFYIYELIFMNVKSQTL